MAGLYLDLTPAYLYTQNGEPDRIPIQNRIVMELRNPSPEESVILKNDAKKNILNYLLMIMQPSWKDLPVFICALT